jgi:DNA polymerase-3 subunit chi
VQAGSPLAARTPVVLTHEGHAEGNSGHVPHHDVLVNLDPAAPLFFSRFDFLLEVIGRDEPERDAGRRRWKFYADRGYAMHHHDRSSSSVDGH